MDAIKYKGKVTISRINSETQLPIANDIVIFNSGTSNLWSLICQLLLNGNAGNDPEVNIPVAIDIGYFNFNAQTILNEKIFQGDPKNYNTQFHSFIASNGNLFVDKRIIMAGTNTDDNYGTPVLEFTSYFSRASFVNTATGSSPVCIVLKDNTANGNILAVASTGSPNYSIDDNETQIIKWQLSFQNVVATSSQGS